ncbi:MAG: hypothetical protein P4L91_03355 [Burkholderiaceae bacterium]|nr:hypothetical protein [Burkholderiaceae bacterium]
MNAQARQIDRPRQPRTAFLAFCAFAAILFGIKLLVIGAYGNATPFRDQWNAEAMKLYKPFLDGTLDWSALFAPDHEHRILTTRLLHLALLTLNGIWNPLLQMLVNALLHVTTLALAIGLLARVVGQKYLPVMLLFSLVLFGIPFAWENTLWGFQAQFYFVLLFGLACLWLTVTKPPLSSAWWGGILCAILAFFSLASGIFALAAAATVGLLMYVTGLRKDRAQLIAIAILVGIFVAGVFLTPTIAKHAQLKASSVSQLLKSLATVFSWPIPIPPAFCFGPLILNAPILIFAGTLLRKRPPANDRRWFLLALIIWTVGQSASIAYGRATINYSSRYLDILSVGVLLNFASLISILQDNLGRFDKRKFDAAITWILIIVASLALEAYDWVQYDIAARRDDVQVLENDTKNYFATGDMRYLNDKALEFMLFVTPQDYATILATPEVASILPANIRPPIPFASVDSEPAGSFIVGGVSPATSTGAEKAVGNYRAEGNSATGKASIRFATPRRARLAIPLAGYPLAAGNAIVIAQNGQRLPLTVAANPGNSWTIAYANVEPGAFSIELLGANASAWLAIKPPTVVGRLDAFVTALLRNALLFVALGVVLGLALLAQYLMARRARVKRLIARE